MHRLQADDGPYISVATRGSGGGEVSHNGPGNGDDVCPSGRGRRANRVVGAEWMLQHLGAPARVTGRDGEHPRVPTESRVPAWQEVLMIDRRTSVYGIYQDRAAVEGGVAALVRSGFLNGDVSVLLPHSDSTREFAHEKHTKAPEGTATGATAGGAIGGTLGVLAGIGVLTIPGVGPFIAAGPLMGALAGIGAGGVVGGLIGALAGLGIPEYEAKRYAGRVKDGGVLLSVHCDTSDEIEAAKRVLKNTGAEDISTAAEDKGDHDPGPSGDGRYGASM
jgi:hypothetical protein